MANGNPKVFFDLEVGGHRAGRIVMELFADTTPLTAENFRALCTGEKGVGSFGKLLHLKGSRFHEITPGIIWKGGDFVNGDGSGGESIYGPVFADENFDKFHDRPGILSMLTDVPDENGSQFQILMKDSAIRDGSQVVFGQVVKGLELMKSIEVVAGNPDGIPSPPVIIANCGVMNNEPKGLGVDESKGLVVDQSKAFRSARITMQLKYAITRDKLQAAQKKLWEMQRAKFHRTGEAPRDGEGQNPSKRPRK